MSREYKTGTRWCLWRWKRLGYIDRLHLVQTPLFSICLHWVNHPDPEPWLHDHPVSFLSIILRGGYTEHRTYIEGPFILDRLMRRRWFNWVRADSEDRHRITRVEPGTLTLCLMGPRRREWGFHAPDRWISWQEYYDRFKAMRRPL